MLHFYRQSIIVLLMLGLFPGCLEEIKDDFDLDQEQSGEGEEEELTYHDLTVSTQGDGTVATVLVSGEVVAGQYLSGSVVELTATAGEGLEFGGWQEGVKDVINPLTLTITNDLETTAVFFSGESCVDSEMSDVFGSLSVETTHPIGAKDHGCMVVKAEDGFPVVDGDSSARFEVRPGDCSGNEGFNDCDHDRSRHELNEINLPEVDGSVVRYSTSIFLPEQSRLKPAGNNILILGQINVSDTDVFTSLAYLMLSNLGKLFIRTHQDFSWTPANDYYVEGDPFGRWIKIDYEIGGSTTDGSLKFYADDVLLGTESRATLPSANALIALRLGIYNAFLSDATEEFQNQVIYMDGVTKTISE